MSRSITMENKKISFGFNKVTKKNKIVSKTAKHEEKPVELIECFEDQSIKIKDAVEEHAGPLVIPIKGSSNKLLDQIKNAKQNRIEKEVKTEESKPEAELTLDELAARELIREAQNRDTLKIESKVFSLPLKEEKFVAEGAIEPSLEDYESVPISDYGMAMLRGMNWTEGMPIGKRTKKTETPKLPELRPKGLGLGANKMVNSSKPAPSVDKNGKELQLVKAAFCKIIAGNHRSHYCVVQGLDDENCRVIVKLALTNEVLSLNEFLIVPVSKDEYLKNSRVINNEKYEKFKHKSKSEVRCSSPDERRNSSPDLSSKKMKKSKKKYKHSSDSEDDRRKAKTVSRRKYLDSKDARRTHKKESSSSTSSTSYRRSSSSEPDYSRIRRRDRETKR